MNIPATVYQSRSTQAQSNQNPSPLSSSLQNPYISQTRFTTGNQGHQATPQGPQLSPQEEKLKQQFQNFIRKLDASNSVKSRVQTIRDIDQLIQKKNQKALKILNQQQMHGNTFSGPGGSNSGYSNLNNPNYSGMSGSTSGQVSGSGSFGSSSQGTTFGSNGKFEFPFCLSVIIVKIADLILNPKDVKKDYKSDIDSLVIRCFFQQRCLVYKLPQFLLNFMEQYQDSQMKLSYIRFLTNEGLEVDPSFNTQLFIILLKLIDSSLKTPQYEILSFLKNILDYNPKAFTEHQTLSLLLRISLVGISSINQNQSDNCTEVCQILQYLLKYNDYSPKLLNASLLTMCVLSNRDPYTFPIWNILKHIIIQDKKFIFQELIEILQIPLRCTYFEKKVGNDNQQQQLQQQQLTFNQMIKKEIQFKCFRESMTNMVIEFDDLQYNLSFHNQPTLYPSSSSASDSYRAKMLNNPKMTIHELICRNKCELKFYEIDLWEDIHKVERQSQNAFAFDRTKLQDLINILQDDRNLWINTFEKNIDRVQKGAIFFVGKILWSQDKIEDIYFPINQILQIFNNLITNKRTTTKFNVISEIFGATKQLVLNKQNTLFFEWEGILKIIDSLTDYIDDLVNKKRIDSIYEMFKVIRNQLLVNKFPQFLEGQALKIYLKYKNLRVVIDKTLTQLSICYILSNDFMGSFQLVIESCLTNERSAEIRSLFLDMLSNFYEDCEEVSTCTLLEAVFANNTEHFYLTRKEGSYTTAQIIQIIDMLVVMGCKTTKSTNFRHLMQILSECINCFEFDKSGMQNANETSMSGFTNIQQIKQNYLNKGTVNYLNSDQIKMKTFQSHALTRMIQLFILKSQTVEYEKSIYVYNILLTTLKLQSNDRRQVICNELLFNLKVNTHKEMCWQSTDNPVFVDIQKINMDVGDANDQQQQQRTWQSDSQGNSSSGGGSNGSANRLSMLFKGSRDSSQTQMGRSSLNKLLEEKYIVQNTLKALIACIEDDTSSSEIKLSCLKLFQRFMVYLQEDDFLNLELLEHDQQTNKQALQDGKSEWIRIVQVLLKNFDPIEEADYSFVILEIFQTLLSLQNYQSAHPIMTIELHQLILEQLIKSISYSQQSISKQQEQDFMRDPNSFQAAHLSKSLLEAYVSKFQQMGGIAGQRQMQKSQIKASRAGVDSALGAGGDQLQLVNVKQLVKFMKRAISIIGYSFTVDNSGDHRVWLQPVSQQFQIRVSVAQQEMNNNSSGGFKEQRLIEYFVDQLTLVVMNDLLLPRLTLSLLICIQNISDSVIQNLDSSMLRRTTLSDYLIYLNTRIGFPYLISRCEMTDPLFRYKNNLHRMTKNLREIFKECFLADELLYQFYMLNHQEFTQVKMQLVIMNMLQLLLINKSEETISSILTLVMYQMIVKDREKMGKERNKELRKREKYYACFVDCLSAILIWTSHSVYDRNCSISLPLSILEAQSGVHHFIWNRNLITIAQEESTYSVFVRNPVYNFHTQVNVYNKVQQISNGDKSQIDLLKTLVRGQDNKNNANFNEINVRNEEQSKSKEDDYLKTLKKVIYNDNTLMALIEPGALLNYKKQRELMLCEEDQTLRNYIQILDMIPPKDCFSISVYYVQKHTDPQELRLLSDLRVDGMKVSKAHLYFLSMLGQITDGKSEDKNHQLYLKNTIDEKSEQKLIINEDNLNFMIFLSNTLNSDDKGKSKLNSGNSSSKVGIIYNESNIDDFTKYDPNKIFLIFSKLNEHSYLFKIQHSHNEHKLLKFKSEVYSDGEDIRDAIQQVPSSLRDNQQQQQHLRNTTATNYSQQQLNQQNNNFGLPNTHLSQTNLSSNLPTPPTLQTSISSQFDQQNIHPSKQGSQKEKKFQTGFYSELAIVPKEIIGEFVKKMCILTDMADRRQRYGKECIISNLIQRGMKIKEIKEKKINNAKFTSILKQQ